MKYIKLTLGQVAIVDDKWFEYLNQWKWMAIWVESIQTFYAFRRDWRTQKRTWMHRVVMNTPYGLIVDHIHHNGLDNRESELRNVTHSQNSMNRKEANINNVINQRNITLRDNGTYRVRLMVKGVSVFDKTVETMKEAKKICALAARRLHGNFH